MPIYSYLLLRVGINEVAAFYSREKMKAMYTEMYMYNECMQLIDNESHVYIL